MFDMRMLDALDFAARPTGPAIAKKLALSTSAGGSTSAERAEEHAKAARNGRHDKDFEKNLNGLVAAGTLTPPATVSTILEAVRQTPADDRLCPGIDGALTEGAPSAIGKVLGEPGGAALPPTGAPAKPVEATAAGAVAAPSSSNASRSNASGLGPDQSALEGRHSVKVFLNESGLPPLSPVGTMGKSEGTETQLSGDQTATAFDGFSQPVLSATLAQKLRDTFPVTDTANYGDLHAKLEPTAMLAPIGSFSNASSTNGLAVSSGHGFGQDLLTASDALPALVADGAAKFETRIGAHDDQLWRIESVSAAQSGLVSQSDVSNDSLDHEQGESEDPQESVGVDSLFANNALADHTHNTINAESTRSESVPSATVADQIFGEIASHVELSRREGRVDFRMRLDPPGLGTVQVHLTATGNTVSAQLVVDDEAARHAIESQLHTLRETLADLGVTLERSFVARDGGGSGAGGAWRWQHPEPPSGTSRASPPGFSHQPVVSTSRQKTGVIDVVV